VIVRTAIYLSFPLPSAVVVLVGRLERSRRQLLKGWQVKYSKVAAVVAGSVMAVGVGAPAFAADSSRAPAMPTSINGGVDQLLEAQPLQKAVDGTHVENALGTVTRSADSLRGSGAGALLGQAAGATKGVVPSLLGGLPVTSLLGGLPLAH
jgi:hypothetical protein